MNIGILTFHEATNYGAVLQAWALKESLTRLGWNASFVPVEGIGESLPAYSSRSLAQGGDPRFAARLQAISGGRKRLFSDFTQKWLPSGPSYQDPQELNDHYDCFVTGSDQVWNYLLTRGDERFFLGFTAPEKRWSYAASFGGVAPSQAMEETYRKGLQEFRGLSVREESGRSLVQELTGRQDVKVCVDPTLLLTGPDWEPLIPQTPAEDHVLLYLLMADEKLTAAAQAEADRLGVPLKVVTGALIPPFGLQGWQGTGVQGWLQQVKTARRVYTNSFHGVVFSCLFHRPFTVNGFSGPMASRNTRILELLELTGLNHCMLGQEPQDIDWEQVDRRLADARKESLVYLKQIGGAAR